MDPPANGQHRQSQQMERGELSYFAPHVGDHDGHDGLPARVPSSTTPLDEAPPTPSTEHPPPVRHPPATAARNVQFRSLDRQQSAIRLRRLKTRPPSLSSIKENRAVPSQNPGPASSQQAGLSQDDPLPVVVQPLGSVPEHGSQQGAGPQEVAVVAGDPHRGGFHRLLGRRRHPAPAQPAQGGDEDDCYDSRIVDILDVIGNGFPPRFSRHALMIPVWQTLKLPPSRPSRISRIPSTFPIWADGSTVDRHTISHTSRRSLAPFPSRRKT